MKPAIYLYGVIEAVAGQVAIFISTIYRTNELGCIRRSFLPATANFNGTPFLLCPVFVLTQVKFESHTTRDTGGCNCYTSVNSTVGSGQFKTFNNRIVRYWTYTVNFCLQTETTLRKRVTLIVWKSKLFLYSFNGGKGVTS